MRWLLHCLLGLGLLLGTGLSARAADARLVKVLPHFLDQQGRHTLSPSLFDRDAYQAHLRNHPEERSALRFDVQWKGRPSKGSQLKLRVELRGVSTGSVPAELTLETPLNRRGWFSQWSPLTLGGEDYRQFGDVTAWRTTLWDGDRLVSEHRSFLW